MIDSARTDSDHLSRIDARQRPPAIERNLFISTVAVSALSSRPAGARRRQRESGEVCLARARRAATALISGQFVIGIDHALKLVVERTACSGGAGHRIVLRPSSVGSDPGPHRTLLRCHQQRPVTTGSCKHLPGHPRSRPESDEDHNMVGKLLRRSDGASTIRRRARRVLATGRTTRATEPSSA